MEKQIIKVGITGGDIGGIGYETIIKAFLDNRMLESYCVTVYGSKAAAGFYKKTIKNGANFNFNVISNLKQANLQRVNLIQCGEDIKSEIVPGSVNPGAGELAVAALERAVADVKKGDLDVLVTCPIDKNTMADAGFNFIGHTEFLAAEFENAPCLMFMVSQTLKVGLVTMHLPIKEVNGMITQEKIGDKLNLINKSMLRDFAVNKAKIAVLGLNPHSGEKGRLGDEEVDVIEPAIENARKQKILAFGPMAADGFFGSGAYAKYDAVLAMYHDQGLTPFKTIAFEDGVNFTAGLPIVRTSPAHGVGYDIAGKDLADPAPLRAAINWAADIFKNRKIFDQISQNPLPNYHRTEKFKEDRSANVEDLLPQHEEQMDY